MNVGNSISSQINSRNRQDFGRLQLLLAERIEASLKDKTELAWSPEVIDLIRDRFPVSCQHANIRLPGERMKTLFSAVVDEILGLGPNHNNRPHDELEEYISRYPGVIVAYDGMSYA